MSNYVYNTCLCVYIYIYIYVYIWIYVAVTDSRDDTVFGVFCPV